MLAVIIAQLSCRSTVVTRSVSGVMTMLTPIVMFSPFGHGPRVSLFRHNLSLEELGFGVQGFRV